MGNQTRRFRRGRAGPGSGSARDRSWSRSSRPIPNPIPTGFGHDDEPRTLSLTVAATDSRPRRSSDNDVNCAARSPTPRRQRINLGTNPIPLHGRFDGDAHPAARGYHTCRPRTRIASRATLRDTPCRHVGRPLPAEVRQQRAVAGSGARKSRTSRVMTTANTPSLNSSTRRVSEMPSPLDPAGCSSDGPVGAVSLYRPLGYWSYWVESFEAWSAKLPSSMPVAWPISIR